MNNSALGYLFVVYAFSCVIISTGLSNYQHSTQPDVPEKFAQIKPLPLFADIANTQERKLAFFSYLRPAIAEQNKLYRQQRQQLLHIQARAKQDFQLSADQHQFLNNLSTRYRVSTELSLAEQLSELLIRIDVIPDAMVLAQAAMESGWGSSRFAREANNLFGQWCFTAGCGLVPSRRPAGATHEVARFDSVDDAIAAYYRNINSHPAYKMVRQIRMDEREKGEQPSGYAMVAGLDKYSAKGQDYIDELRAMIRSNHLEG